MVEADASDTGIWALLSQCSSADQKLHPCAFCSRHLSPDKRNSDVGNRKLLVVILSLQEWRCWLEGVAHPFLAWTNHKNLPLSQRTELPLGPLGFVPGAFRLHTHILPRVQKH